MEIPTIAGQAVLSIKRTQQAMGGAGRSTVYRLIQDGKLEAIDVPGVGTRITAASILKHLGIAVPAVPPPAAPGPPAAYAEGQPPKRRRGRPRSPRGQYLPAGSQAA
jgi:excisionase family DNA binding protein